MNTEITTTIKQQDRDFFMIANENWGTCSFNEEWEDDIECPYTGEITEGAHYVLISGLDVDKKHRRQGIGRALLRAAIAHIEATWPGLPIRLSSHPQEDNISYEDLTAFYESEGFEVIIDDDVVIMER